MEIFEFLKSIQVWTFLLFVVSFVGSLIAISSLIRSVRNALPKPGVTSREVLTSNEQEFFGRLKRALPDYDVLPQVAMGAILKTTVNDDHPQYWEIRRQFSQKIIDFVIYRRTAKANENRVVGVVELDDCTHDRRMDARRDAMLASAGIRTLRFESSFKPSEPDIRRHVLALASSR